MDANTPEQVARAMCRVMCRGDFLPWETDDGITCKPEACRHWQLYFESAHILYMLYPALAKDGLPTQSQIAFESSRAASVLRRKIGAVIRRTLPQDASQETRDFAAILAKALVKELAEKPNR